MYCTADGRAHNIEPLKVAQSLVTTLAKNLVTTLVTTLVTNLVMATT